MVVESDSAIVLAPGNSPVKFNKVASHAASDQSGKPVGHWGIADVQRLMGAARARARVGKGDRDALMIQTTFDGALRCSEALGVRPMDITKTDTGYRLQVDGKTGPRQVAVSPSLVAALQSYAYEHQLDRADRFFPITRHRAWQIVEAAAEVAGLVKPPGVGMVHVLRHSGAIERMRITGNPRSVQDQLGHASPAMTLRYFRTLSQQESLNIQEGVDFSW